MRECFKTKQQSKIFVKVQEMNGTCCIEWLNNTLCALQFSNLIFHNVHKLQSLKRHTIDFSLSLSLSSFRLISCMFVVSQPLFLCRAAKEIKSDFNNNKSGAWLAQMVTKVCNCFIISIFDPVTQPKRKWHKSYLNQKITSRDTFSRHNTSS